MENFNCPGPKNGGIKGILISDPNTTTTAEAMFFCDIASQIADEHNLEQVSIGDAHYTRITTK